MSFISHLRLPTKHRDLKESKDEFGTLIDRTRFTAGSRSKILDKTQSRGYLEKMVKTSLNALETKNA